MSPPIPLVPKSSPRWGVYLRLGRVSNLPTVWSNALAGSILAGAEPSGTGIVSLLAAVSLFYTAGMFLNDAFDHRWDAQFRPERPIPAGQVEARRVFLAGFVMLALAVLTLARPWRLAAGQDLQWEAVSWGLLLALLIIYYNWRHKTDPLAPAVMALCRASLYFVGAASATTAWIWPVWLGACLLFFYTIGLTLIARHESRGSLPQWGPLSLVSLPLLWALPGLGQSGLHAVTYLLFLAWMVYALSSLRQDRVPAAVTRLIAGMALLDALLLVFSPGPEEWAAIAALCFLLTLLLQRRIPGT